jgi:choline O-acetyltransferase
MYLSLCPNFSLFPRNEIPIEKAASREPGQPLCMAQHYRLMTTYRVPGLPRDSQRDTSAALVDHIIVAYKNHVRQKTAS